MSEYIEREVIRSELHFLCDKYNICFGEDYGGFGTALAKFADALPTADVAPVVHGYWKPIYSDKILEHPKRAKYYECSVCGGISIDEIYSHGLDFNFCPYCGAKMDLDGEPHDP